MGKMYTSSLWKECVSKRKFHPGLRPAGYGVWRTKIWSNFDFVGYMDEFIYITSCVKNKHSVLLSFALLNRSIFSPYLEFFRDLYTNDVFTVTKSDDWNLNDYVLTSTKLWARWILNRFTSFIVYFVAKYVRCWHDAMIICKSIRSITEARTT